MRFVKTNSGQSAPRASNPMGFLLLRICLALTVVAFCIGIATESDPAFYITFAAYAASLALAAVLAFQSRGARWIALLLVAFGIIAGIQYVRFCVGARTARDLMERKLREEEAR